MLVAPTTSGLDKPGTFAELQQQLGGMLEGERDGLANCANTAALIYHALPELNWAGFYFLRDGELVLGAFQGKVACVRIPLGSGVCGTAAARRETLVVPDVHAFPGHIACDADSRSEIVVPLIRSGVLPCSDITIMFIISKRLAFLGLVLESEMTAARLVPV